MLALLLTEKAMHWTRKYVGLPWVLAGRDHSGADCWGLLWLVYMEQLGVGLPSYAAETIDGPERDEISGMIRDERMKSRWTPVHYGHEREFDMIIMRRAGIESHVGIVVGCKQMLHVVCGSEARVERFDQGRWNARIAGIYRHAMIGADHAV